MSLEVVLVLNGTPPPVHRLRELAALHPVIAADGGAGICLRAGVKPLAVVGDFDSMSPGDFPADWTLRLALDQSFTDFEKVIQALPGGTDRVRILGGLGARLDHLFSNLLIAAGMPPAWEVTLESEDETLVRVTPDCAYAGEPAIDSILSLLPMGKVEGVQATGLRWNLAAATLGPGYGVGQSNRVEGPVRVSVGRGVLYLWSPTR